MAAKGSRKNPYTQSEYNSIDIWRGGWIQETETSIIYRAEQPLTTYSGRCDKGNPVPGDIYNEMSRNGIWLGGWVKFGTTLKYVDSNENEYNSTLGYQSNPYPYSIYNEMVSNDIWESGWIIDYYGSVRYVQNFTFTLMAGSGCGCGSGSGSGSSSGSGSGSGSGCGCGCGCGSGSGSANGGSIADTYPVSGGEYLLGDLIVKYGDTNNALNSVNAGIVYIKWDSGNTAGESNLASAWLEIRLTNPRYHIENIHIKYSWKSPYTISFEGSLIFEDDGIRYFCEINNSFAIPANYHYDAPPAL